jgi:hypothetical protein
MKFTQTNIQDNKMPTWKSKICRGMDVVETITYTRQDVDANGKAIFTVATHVPSEEKARSEWTQAEIDAIGDAVVADLDSELERLKTNPIGELA